MTMLSMATSKGDALKMADALPKIDRELLSVLVRGAEKTFDNAEKLFTEAQILAKVGATARALCLHQISLEECSKVESLGAWAASLLAGVGADKGRILTAFRSHASKNKKNAYMAEASPAEKDARARGDWDTAKKEFEKLQAEFNKTSNDAKNASLYVDWKGDEFVSPAEQITEVMLNTIIERNKTFLAIDYNSLKMLRRLDKSPEELQDLMVDFVQAAEKFRANKPDDFGAAANELIQSFLNAGSKRFGNKSD
jgi:AbiV family abortive infection protein